MSDASNTWRAGGAFGTGWQAGDVLATGTVFTVDSGGTLHLASIASGHVLGNTGTAAAEPADATLTVLLDINFGAAEGDILYRGASAWAALPAGTSGQVLETQGTTAAPAWITLPTDTDLITAVDTNFAAPGGTLQFAAITSGDLIANAGTGSIEPTATTLTALLDRVIGSTEGEIIIRNGSVWAALAPGTSGQALVTQGSTAAPAWMNEIWNAGSISAIDPSLSAVGGTLAVAGTYATKSYVDTGLAALNPNLSAVVATTTTLPANTYSNGTAGVGATLTANANGTLTIDGFPPALLDYVLAKDEAAQAHNGLYELTQLGDASHPYVLTRVLTFNQVSNVNGPTLPIHVKTGTANANTVWLANSVVATMGTDAITFVEFGLWQAAQVTSLGSGLTNTGGVLSATGGSGGGAFFTAPIIISGGPFSTLNTGTGTVTDLLEFEVTSTISAVDWPINVLVSGDSYVASISPVNASNVVQSVTNSATIIATGTAGAMLHFTFSPSVVCNTGTKYAFSCSDITALKNLPVHYNNARLYMRNTVQLGGTGHDTFQNTVTRIAVGTTLAAEAVGFWLMAMDVTP